MACRLDYSNCLAGLLSAIALFVTALPAVGDPDPQFSDRPPEFEKSSYKCLGAHR